jgi:ubiquinol-cytochrome c reductase cytochrome c subunit
MKRLLIGTVMAWLLATAVSAAGQDDDGEQLFLNECAGCHGPHGQGSPWAPAIVDQGAAGADFMMRTGRMPLRHREDPIRRGPRLLTDQQISAIADFVGTLGGPPIPTVSPEQGDLGSGADLYLLNCAACHGSTGVGGALVASRNAPPVLPSDAIEIAEAIRAGPGPMPAYPEEVLSQQELDSLTRYVLSLSDAATPGGWSLGRWGPVAEGAAAWLIGLGGVIGAAMWIEGQTGEWLP